MLQRKWSIRKTLYEMLADRGYDINREKQEETLESFTKNYQDSNGVQDSMAILVAHKDDPNDRLMALFSKGDDGSRKTGVKPIRVFAEKMQETNVKRGILIVEHELTSFARSAINEVQPSLDVEVFLEAELEINITKHELVPPHIPLSKKEKQEVLDQYKATINQLPRITKEDPVARYLGLKRGDIVKIQRPSETAGRYVNYRVCT